MASKSTPQWYSNIRIQNSTYSLKSQLSYLFLIKSSVLIEIDAHQWYIISDVDISKSSIFIILNKLSMFKNFLSLKALNVILNNARLQLNALFISLLSEYFFLKSRKCIGICDHTKVRNLSKHLTMKLVSLNCHYLTNAILKNISNNSFLTNILSAFPSFKFIFIIRVSGALMSLLTA